jgi:large repetitive protein
VFAATSGPNSQGSDVTANSYRYSSNGADGMAFVLASVNPSDPPSPASTGQPSGALGFPTTGTARPIPRRGTGPVLALPLA